ncbi:MAG: histidine kinase [Chitinophagaceae bacterium]|nr:histidine kinase [Chitinophagaceae bacterium]
MSQLQQTILIVATSTIMLGVAIYLLSIFNRLFLGIRNIWLRKNLAVLLVGVCFMLSMIAVSTEIVMKAQQKGFLEAFLVQLGQSVIIILFVFNFVWAVRQIPGVKSMSFVAHHAVIISSIVVAALIIYTLINFLYHGYQFKELRFTIIFAFYNALATGLIYTAVNYVDLDRKRKLNEKELEVARLTVLKTKAELDALHSKVNPHFLYNALNSIADLSITDGKKARKMTIALADLFRYSINYSQNNYSTIQDELEMTEVYLQIEKIRFEDQLNYQIELEDNPRHYLVPRFLLQPLAENAVKHGLKITGKMTEIKIHVSELENGFRIVVADNGPKFPEELVPGYGVKSVFDKLDLLFPGAYVIRFSNEPTKRVEIDIYKLIKNEPAI